MPLAGLIVAAMLARLIWTAYTGHTFEDAFITFQYARRLADGQGFVYNPGERVYGTTTPLFTLLLAGWRLAGGQDPVRGARLFDFAAAAGAIVLAWLTLRQAGSSPVQQFFTLALFCVSSKLWLMDSGGMETPLVPCLLAASWFAYATGRAGWAGALAGLLAAVTLGAATVGAWSIWRDRRLGLLPTFVVLEAARLVLTRATVFNRYLAPALWVTLILLGLGLGRLWDRTRTGRRPARFGLVLALTATLALGAVMSVQRAQAVRDTQRYRHEAALTRIGVWLNQNTPPGSTVLLEPLGYAGYYADRRILDEVGLVTPQVTALKRQGLFDVYEYLPRLQPEAVVLHCDDSLRWQERAEAGEDLFSAHYVRSAVFNPLSFDPSPSAPVDPRPPAVLRRNACYEIWVRAPGG